MANSWITRWLKLHPKSQHSEIEVETEMEAFQNTNGIDKLDLIDTDYAPPLHVWLILDNDNFIIKTCQSAKEAEIFLENNSINETNGYRIVMMQEIKSM